MASRAGGNMTAAVALLSKQRRGPKISFQLLFYPVTDANFETGSYTQFQNGPWLTKSAMEWFWNAYLPDRAARKEIIAAPLSAKPNQLEGFPDALVTTAENDVLRDEDEAYARKLWEAGVRVTCTRYIGTIHDFVMLNAIRRRTAGARCYCSSQRYADILRSMSARGSNGLPQQLGGGSLAFWALQFGAR